MTRAETSIAIQLNGRPHNLAGEYSVAALIESLSLTPERVAVEINRVLVRRANFESTQLQQGDLVEVVTLVGGG
jgi:thiamine biosynthesis protein ThiS